MSRAINNNQIPVKTNFDNIANLYGLMETLCAGKLLHRSRTHHLAHIHPPNSILIMGEGHGTFLGLCEQQFPEASITVVDSSEQMIAVTKGKHPTSKANFVHADALQWKPKPSSYDLIVSHYFLDCFTKTQLSKVVTSLSQAATPRAQWLIADFEIPNKGLKRWRSRIILFMLYRFFGCLTHIPASTLSAPDTDLIKQDFHLKERHTFDWGLLKSELWQRS